MRDIRKKRSFQIGVDILFGGIIAAIISMPFLILLAVFKQPPATAWAVFGLAALGTFMYMRRRH